MSSFLKVIFKNKFKCRIKEKLCHTSIVNSSKKVYFAQAALMKKVNAVAIIKCHSNSVRVLRKDYHAKVDLRASVACCIKVRNPCNQWFQNLQVKLNQCQVQMTC